MRSKNAKVFSHAKIVGLFDFDKEGTENFHHLKKDNYWSDTVYGDKVTGLYRKRTDHPSWHSMLLPIPDRLSLLADLSHDNFSSYVEIENLLPSDYLVKNKFVDEKAIVGQRYFKVKSDCKKIYGYRWLDSIEIIFVILRIYLRHLKNLQVSDYCFAIPILFKKI